MKPNAPLPHVLKVVAALMKAGREQDAARILIRDLRRSSTPREADISKWLVRTIGAKPATRLLHTLAHYPCFYCEHGLEECNLCGWQSQTGEKRGCCEHCLDLLYARCDFCDGSGWITYNAIPQDLWPAVVVVRTNAALKRLTDLMKNRLPAVTPTEPTQARELLEREQLVLNRLAGIFENAVDATRKYPARNSPTFKPVAAKVLNTSTTAWEKIQARMRQTLLLLAVAIRSEAGLGATAKAQAIMEARADFYTMLAESRAFEGTSLSHPFLPSRP